MGIIGVEPVMEKAPTWLSKLAIEEKGEKEFLKKLSTSKDFQKLIEEGKADDDPTAVLRGMGKVQGQTFKLIIGPARKEGAVTRAFESQSKPDEIAKALMKDQEFTKVVKKTFDEAKAKAEAQRKQNLAAPGFGHIFVESLNEKLAKTEGLVLVKPENEAATAN